MSQENKKFTKGALRKARDYKHTYSETFVEPMDPCKPVNKKKK